MNESDPNESEPRKLWTFPEGTVSHDQSVKGYRSEATDGEVGEVSWADYAPGQSYMVVTLRHHLRDVNHVVPAGAIASVDHDTDQFERSMLGGGGVWPYDDR